MSGFPDYQRYSQWIGSPLAAAVDLAIGAGSHTDGPSEAGNWSSVILYIKPTGGSITATIRQTATGLDATLIADTVVVAAAGTVVVEAVVLLGNRVTLILQGSAGGETVTYALLPSNTAVNAATIGGSGVTNIAPIPLASWPPASPADGDLQVLELPTSYDPVGGKLTRWLCHYDAASSMWEVAGASLVSQVATLENSASVTYGALATAGPAVALPRAGDYDVQIGATIDYSNSQSRMSYDIGGTGAVDADAVLSSGVSADIGLPKALARSQRKAGLTAVTLTAKYKSNISNGNFSARWMRVTPVRIT